LKKGFVAIPVLLLLLAVSACNNTSSKLMGEWRHVKEVSDANRNGTMDAADSAKDLTGEDLFIIFNRDGTLIVSYNGATNADNPAENKWSIEGNDYLKIANKTDSSSSVIYLHIDELTSKKLTLKDTSGGVTTWNVWKKRE
jgi:hypothetical protein